MRLVILSYSHHGRGIGQTVRALGHDIIGVMDGEEGLAPTTCRDFPMPRLCLSGRVPRRRAARRGPSRWQAH